MTKKRFTLKDDLFLAEYEGLDANFIASHDLGRTSKGAGARRVKALKDSGIWDRMQSFIKARDALSYHHTLLFIASPEAKVIAVQGLLEIGEDLPPEAMESLELIGKANKLAAKFLERLHAENTHSSEVSA